jgi:hypothetical protein
LDLLRINLRRIRDCLLNRTFDLTLRGARRRRLALAILFLLLLAVILVALHPQPTEWTTRIRNVLIYLLDPNAAFQVNPLFDLFSFALGGSWTNFFRYLPLLLFPYVTAIRLAALYLADIFEKPVKIAERFITEVALYGGSETVNIRDGEFKNKEESRIYAIGGPGYVEVDRNSVALFEQPDGRPHVIGPTVDGAAPLDGFERLRAVLDLRDQHFDLREQDNREIPSRTLDGLRVSAIDVSMRFSIWRGEQNQRTLNMPNPYLNDMVVQTLIYNQSLGVNKTARPKDSTAELASPLGPSMVSSIRGELGRFMSEQRLTEFFASHGTQEITEEGNQIAQIQDAAQRVLPPGSDRLQLNGTPVPDFVPRPVLYARFHANFIEDAHRRGVHRNWIGVGAWKTPIEIITNKHLEAWKLSIENQTALNGIERQREQAAFEETVKMIREIIAEQAYSASRGAEAPRVMRSLLEKYYGQLRLARDVYQRQGVFPPAELREALRHILNLLAHYV